VATETRKQIAEGLTRLTELYQQLIHLEEPAMLAASQFKPSGFEQRVINALGRGKMLGKNIAKAIDVEYNRGFQGRLSTMARYGVLVHDADGYTVATSHLHLVGMAAEDEDEAS
jgi:hypothetical protein